MPDLHSITAPCVIAFELPLADSILVINEVVRVVPSKRLVCKAIWNNQLVYAKVFIGKEAKRYAQRDQQGVQLLVKANIATPDLLYAGSNEIGHVLLFKALENAKNAELLYEELIESTQVDYVEKRAARLHLLMQLTEVVALLHRADLQQTDLHFKNFLVDGETLYTIDGDGIQAFSPFFKKRQKQFNLATFFSKMDALDIAWIDECYTRYCVLTETKYSVSDYSYIHQLAQKLRQKAVSRYADKKVFRTCTDVKVSQSFGQYRALQRGFDSKHIPAQKLDEALSNMSNRLKSGNTCTVGQAVIDNQTVVIKRYNIKNFLHGLKLSVSQSRAAKSWANAHRLSILNIATAKPLALIEERFGWIKRRAYFLTAYIEAPDIAEFFAQTSDVAIKEKVAYETALLFYKLNLLMISHGDCKASNIKIVDGKPVLIDLDSMRAHTSIGFFGHWWFEKKHIKDLKRFMQNWVDSPETSAIFKEAFLQVYDEIDDYLVVPILQRAKIT